MNNLKEEDTSTKKPLLYNFIFIILMFALMSCSLIVTSINPYKTTIVIGLFMRFNKELLLLFFCSTLMIINTPESKFDFHLKTKKVLYLILLDTSLLMAFSLFIEFLIKRIGG